MKPQLSDILSVQYIQDLCQQYEIDPNTTDTKDTDRLQIRRIRGAMSVQQFRDSGGTGWTWNQVIDMYINAINEGATWAECNESCTYYYGITIWALAAIYFAALF